MRIDSLFLYINLIPPMLYALDYSVWNAIIGELKQITLSLSVSQVCVIFVNLRACLVYEMLLSMIIIRMEYCNPS